MKVLFKAGVSGNSKQRRRRVRLWQKMGYKVERYYRVLWCGTFKVGLVIV
jgi:hypothetical protein